MAEKVKFCLWCKEPFKWRRENQKFCSKSCQISNKNHNHIWTQKERNRVSKQFKNKKIIGRKGHKSWMKGLTKQIDSRIKKMADNKLGDKNVSKRPEIRQRLKESRIRQNIESGAWYQIGKHEKQLLDEQEVKDNCKILRQYQISVYVVDGYCKETNTVYEVYEKAHDKKVFEDLDRENEICKKLSCDFIIIWDK